MVHRWTRGVDIVALLWLLRQMIDRSGSIEGFFREGYDPEAADIGGRARQLFAPGAGARSEGGLRAARPGAHGRLLLLSASVGGERLQAAEPVPALDGAAATKWTSGAWTSIPRSKLIVPLDTHVIRLGRCLRLTRYTSPGWRMAAEITASLRAIDPVDPVRFDFSICHVGMMNACGFGRRQGDAQCPLKGICRPRARAAAAAPRSRSLIVVFVAAMRRRSRAGWFLGARRTVLDGAVARAGRGRLRVRGALRQGAVPVAVDRDGHEAGGRWRRCSAGPAEQAGEIAWTPDGSRVAFIVNGYQLRLFDGRTGANLGAVVPDRARRLPVQPHRPRRHVLGQRRRRHLRRLPARSLGVQAGVRRHQEVVYGRSENRAHDPSQTTARDRAPRVMGGSSSRPYASTCGCMATRR